MEVWKDIPGYGGNYQASNLGKIRSKDRLVSKFSGVCGKNVKQAYKGRELTSKPNKHGYVYVHISVDRKRSVLHVGRLVLLAFVGDCPEGMECCHGDGNKSNNCILNLRWDTHLENNRDKIKHGTYKRGEDHHFSKFDNNLISKIKTKEIGKKEALSMGVSNTHYYRILKNER